MTMDPKAHLKLWVLVTAGLAQGMVPLLAAAAAGAPLLACSADPVTIGFGGSVHLRAWAESPAGQTLRYVWTAAVGRLRQTGAEADWDLASVLPARYAATVEVEEAGGASAECLVRVDVRRDPVGRPLVPPPPAKPSRETGTSLLLPGRAETPDYGLYSYLLLGSPPSEAALERYRKTIEAYWGLIPEISRLENYVSSRRELNIAYLPVTEAPDRAVSADWLLGRYDYARARSLLRFLPGGNREGPYIVSTLMPLGGAGASGHPGQYLFQDLSKVPPHLVASWVKEFLNQAAQERFWEERTAEQLALKLRLTVGVLGMGLPAVRKALDTWIAWIR